MRRIMLSLLFVSGLARAAWGQETEEAVWFGWAWRPDRLLLDVCWECRCLTEPAGYALIVDGEIIAQFPAEVDCHSFPLGDPATHRVCIRVTFPEEQRQLESCELIVPFIRGDVNLNGILEMGDAISCVGYLFNLGWFGPTSCLEAMDANDSDSVNMADAIYILQYLFAYGTPIPAPYPECGYDSTLVAGRADLGCTSFERCQ
jgi:hypothetical protein